ncbi:type II toxin-antitoxin system RelE/ParE family toxin [Hymenobacter sp. BT507]|uniref:Type II toxin-antitoxin system RelE/ParE family toxin n=1 Tax=Hymenobacter citatus TaxID=2763506 RepID=A0ABR7MK54_9BACT|nr:type II toxin-antitoxin system RelE/ParE family toxin [Hymenobacter citatus]MBC6611453.1 type II toxin-antitoxin system RelE/ParE family toxin [Hymenobacter citatus]
MSFDIKLTSSFKRQLRPLLKRYWSLIEDLSTLEQDLKSNPQVGEPLGKDCYKVRMRIKAKQTGKSGSARVITCVKVVDNQIFLLSIYDKSDQASISTTELTDLLEAAGLK